MQINLRNWIAFQTLSLTLESGNVHVLTGSTGAGKSSVVDAITYACIGVARGYTAKKDARYSRSIQPGQCPCEWTMTETTWQPSCRGPR